MLSISDELKTIYKNDMFPFCTEIADKDLDAYFPDLALTVGADQFAVDKGDFELNESICSNGDIKFGKCNASSVKFTCANVTDAIKGKEFTLTQTVNGSFQLPLGIFKVDSANKQDDLIFKDIVAYDRMKKIDVDVAAWYNSLFPVGNETYTLAAFRSSFLAYVGLTEDTSKLPLPNDSMTVPKTISPSQISGRDVIEAIEEINGAFGKITRDGKFGHRVLPPAYGLYPGTFYPGQEYPRSETDTSYVAPGTIAETVTSGMIESIRFEEYAVKEIDKLIIRQEENDVGAIVGTGSNAYIIEGNFLVFGKSAAELAVIAQNAFGNIAKRPYRPYESTNIGLPYLEVGDMVKFDQTDPVTGYIFQRTLKGIQALQDEVSAEGAQERQQNFGINKQIIQLQGKATKIQKDVDGVKVSVSDLDLQLTSDINALAGQIILKVNTNGNIGFVELTGDPDTDLTQIKLKADNLTLEGLTTINGNLKVLLDGSIEAINSKFSGNVTASEFIGGSIRSQNYASGISGMMIDLDNCIIDMVNLSVDPTGKIKAVGGEFSGKITGSAIEGSTFLSQGAAPSDRLFIDGGFITIGDPSGAHLEILGHRIWFYSDATTVSTDISRGYVGATEMHCQTMNDGLPLTLLNKDSYTYPPASHNHSSINGIIRGTDGKTFTVTNGIISAMA